MGLIAFLVDDIDHRSQGRRLARASRTSHETKSARFVEQFPGRGRQADLLHRQQLAWNLPEHNAEISFLLENADAEPGHFAEGKAEVSATALTDVLDMIFGRNAAHQFFSVFGLECGALYAMENTMHANSRWCPDADMEVG